MTLGLCMIVKNESEVLARVLDGICEAVDEVVVVDTGSTDNTSEIARRYTDKVYDFAWRDDFSAARNFALSKLTTDYWIWLDADDVVPAKTARAIKKFISVSDGSVDAVMMPYVASVDERGKPLFSYYRERILKRRPEFVWQGRVHEAVAVSGNVVRLEQPIVHGKPTERTAGTRNLDIYRAMVMSGQKLSPREQYYYARELFYNGFTQEAAAEFAAFIGTNGAAFNKADACVMLSRCYKLLGDNRSALFAAFDSFAFGLPTGEACCEIGALFFEMNDYKQAAYWYERALRAKPDYASGAFVDRDCYSFVPLVWLCVCYDRLNDKTRAYRYHCRARKIRPEHPSVIANGRYFDGLGFNSN